MVGHSCQRCSKTDEWGNAMNESLDNPCLTCSIGQDCCRKLSGLKLTESEYKQHFAIHREKLEVRQDGQIYVVSSKEGHACPHWSNNQCTVYDERPIECRLFPYTIGVIDRKQGHVLLSFHARTGCPNKKELLVSEDKAKEMVFLFARNAFGGKCIVEIEHEMLLTALKSKLKRLMKLLREYIER